LKQNVSETVRIILYHRLIIGKARQAPVAERPLALPPGSQGERASVDPASHDALALDHVLRGRRIVARQRSLIAEIRARGGDCTGAEGLLSSFERSLAIFEDDLAILQRKNAAP